MIKWYLLWYLSKVADKSQDSALNQRIFNVVEVHLVSIEVRVVGVHCLHCSWAMLLMAKNKVYPAMEVCTDIVTLQCLKTKQNNLIHQTVSITNALLLSNPCWRQILCKTFITLSVPPVPPFSAHTHKTLKETEGQSATCLTSETPEAISSETTQVGSTE